MQLLKYKFEGPNTQKWTRAPLRRTWAPHKTIAPSVKMFANDIIKLRVMVRNYMTLSLSNYRTLSLAMLVLFINYRVNRSLTHINNMSTNAVKEIKLHAINNIKKVLEHSQSVDLLSCAGLVKN